MRGLMAVALAGAVLSAGASISVPERERDDDILDVNDRPDIPDRVSIEQGSPFFWKHYVMLGVRVNGKESNQVVEFCQSEGWVRLCLRNGQGRMKRDRHGQPMTTGRVDAKVEPYWRDQANPEVAVVSPVAETPQRERPAISREQARRLRQAAAKEAKAAKRHG